jgi:hypothetical protein
VVGLIVALMWLGNLSALRSLLVREPVPSRVVSLVGALLLIGAGRVIFRLVPDGSGDNGWLAILIPIAHLVLAALGLAVSVFIPGDGMRRGVMAGSLMAMLVLGTIDVAVLAVAGAEGGTDLDGYEYQGPLWRMAAVVAAVTVAVWALHRIPPPRIRWSISSHGGPVH